MALKELGKNNMFRKSKDIPVGDKLAGYVVGFHRGGKFPDIVNLKMKDESGTTFVLSTSGNLKYFQSNGYKAGYYYEFHRMEDRKNKNGLMVANFKVLVDEDKKCAVESDTIETPIASVTKTTEDTIKF